jgi:antitoxin (DNA-binding transcriptional repressor) of toxin-antitoxin stability system
VATRCYISGMKTVGIRRLKNALSEYVRQVKDGEEVMVTDRGVVVAELRPPTPPEMRSGAPPGLAALARRGLLTLGQPNSSGLYAPVPPLMAHGSAADLLAEERQDLEGT